MDIRDLNHLIDSISPKEKKQFLKELVSVNPKYGSTNHYITLFKGLSNHEIDLSAQLTTAEKKRVERLYFKIWESLGLDYTLNRPGQYDPHVKSKILVKKYEYLAELAKSRNDDKAFLLFLKRALKLVEHSETIIDVTIILTRLERHYLSRRKTKEYSRVRKRIIELQTESERADFLFGFMHRLTTLIHNHENDEIETNIIERVSSEYTTGSEFIRIRRVQLYCKISLTAYLDKGLQDINNRKIVFQGIQELKRLYENNSELFNSTDLSLVRLNTAILYCHFGVIDSAYDLSVLVQKELQPKTYLFSIAEKYTNRFSYFSDNSYQLKSTELADDVLRNEYDYILAIAKIISNQAAVSLLSSLYPLRLKSLEYDFYSRVYIILNSVGRRKFDFAETQIHNLSNVKNKLSDKETSIFNYTFRVLNTWSKKGFQGQIQDLPKELVDPIKEHYENTWNPLSADVIPLHLWNNPKGLPNHKEVYAHLFELKRNKSIEQGFDLN